MKLNLVDGSPPRPDDINSLVTVTISTFVFNGNDITRKLDLSIPTSGIIPFTLSLPEVNSSSSRLEVRQFSPFIHSCRRTGENVMLCVSC